ncbi:MAG: molybdate ABC transporter permease subunit [Rhodothermales bacterium]|nr:molybdate ABC transporter permease subunit [Rhodothermales bacterium]
MLLTPEEWEIVVLSLQLAAAAVLGSLLPGMALAYGLARRRVPLRFVVENVVQLPLVLPPVVTGLLLLLALAPGGPVGRWLEGVLGIHVAFTTAGAALAAAVVAFPLLVQTMRVAFEQIDPAWEEAVYVYGGGRWAVFRYVTLPLAARGIAAAVVLAFARAVGEFGATIVLAGNIPGQTRTIPLAIFTRINQVGGEAAALRLVLVAVALSVLSVLAHALLTRRLHGRAP